MNVSLGAHHDVATNGYKGSRNGTAPTRRSWEVNGQDQDWMPEPD